MGDDVAVDGGAARAAGTGFVWVDRGDPLPRGHVGPAPARDATWRSSRGAFGRYNPAAAVDSSVAIPRSVVPSVVFLRSEIPEAHPSAAVLGTERMGAGVAVGPRQVLTAHYLVLGASQAVVVGATAGCARRAASPSTTRPASPC